MTNPLQHALAKIIGDAIFGHVHPDETPNTWGQSMSAAQDVLAAIVVNAVKEQTPAPAPHKLALGDMPKYGNCTANDMLAAVSDAIFGDRDVSLLWNIDNDRSIGHQMVPNINFNSLNRIISAFYTASPPAPHVTDDMIEAACAAIMKLRGYRWPSSCDDEEQRIARENITVALAAAIATPPAPQVAGWQDIRTAPRDEEILVWNGRRRHVAQWDRVENAWVSSYRTTAKRLEVLPAPTLWQPLPALPDIATEGRNDGN